MNKAEMKMRLLEDLFYIRMSIAKARDDSLSGGSDPIQAGLAVKQIKLLEEVLVVLNNRVDHIDLDLNYD